MFGSRHRSVTRQRGILSRRVFALEILEPRNLLTVYNVGADQAYTTLGSVPWTSVSAGDTVAIHWQPTPYREKILVSVSGTIDNPINIVGVPGPAGQQPVIDGQDATTDSQFKYPSDSLQTQSLLLISRALDQGYDPSYINIQGLEFSNAYYTNTFTNNRGIPQHYDQSAAAVYIAGANNITLRNNTFSNSGLGLFVLSSSDEPQIARNIVVDQDLFSNNGVLNRNSTSNVDTGVAGSTFQYSIFGPADSDSTNLDINNSSIPTDETGTPPMADPVEAVAPPATVADPPPDQFITPADPVEVVAPPATVADPPPDQFITPADPVEVAAPPATVADPPPEVIAHSLASGETAVPSVMVTFSESIVSNLSFTLTGPDGIPVDSTVTYVDASRTATLTPSRPLAATTTYTVTVSNATDSDGNSLAAPFTWSFTTAAATGGPWDQTSIPVMSSEPDINPAELGLKFSPSVAGQITGVRFYKRDGNTGTHLAHLWTSDGTLLATATFTDESASGWQQVSFSNPVAITPGSTYVVSYYAPNGYYAIDPGYFRSGFSNGPLNIPANAGVFAYGSGTTFPTSTWMSSNYWVDVVFAPASTGTPTSSEPQPTPPAPTSQTVTLSASALALDNPGQPPQTLTYTATALSPLFWLDQTYGLYQAPQGYDLNLRGQGEKYLQGRFAGPGDDGLVSYTYYILPNGDLYQIQSAASASPTGVLIAHLGPAVYNDPSLLWNATNSAVPVSLALSGNQLTITSSPGYVGTFVVLATVSDGQESGNQPFLVTVRADASASTDSGNLGAGSPGGGGQDLTSPSQVDATAGTYTPTLPPADTGGAVDPATPTVMTVTMFVPTGTSLLDKALARWESQMIEYGRQAAAEIHATLAAPDVDLTYYDSARVFSQIADYTGDSSWLGAVNDSLTIYRDDFVLPNNGKIPGYWNFTGGLKDDYLRTGNTADRDAVLALSTNMYGADGLAASDTASWELSREVAYSLMANLDAETLGGPHLARTDLLANQALGHLDQWTVSKTATYVKPFMVALTCEALIDYQAKTGDSRVLPAIRTALDWIWANCWNPSARAFEYATGPTEDDPIGTEPAPDLNLLIAPAFAWVYHETGDTTFRDRGDAIFAGGVDQAWLVGAKQFDQSYRWSFDFVKWRTEAPLGS